MKKLFYSVFAIAFMASIFSSCEDVPAPFDDPNTNKQDTTVIEDGSYLNETFEKDFGKFTLKTIKGNDWKINYKTATATGYDNSTKVTTASESYLVSTAIDLSKTTSAYLSFDYILRYVKDGTANKVLITDNYTGDPTTTKWTDISGKLTEGSDWNTFTAYSHTLPTAFVGKSNIVIALYYSCTSATSATWELKNLKLQNGEGTDSGSGDNTGGSTDVAASGDGTQASPYNVTAAIAKAAATNVWVKGYIVGYVSGMTLSSGAVFSADTCTVTTNLLIAASPTETDVKKCMPVQLPKGDVRDGLNISQNKGYYKKEVTLYGAIAAYFSTPGIKSVTYAEIDSKKIGTDPSSTPVTTGTKYTKVSTITDGVYLIAAVDGSDYEVAIPIDASKTYGYLTISKMTATDNVITTDKSAGFTIKNTDKGYTILDANNKYLFMKGTYNSFNVSDSPTEGQYWDIVANSDGTFTITNKSLSKWIQYASKYTSYGAYNTESGVKPCLFKK